MPQSPAWAGDPPRDDDEAQRRIRDAARRCMDRHGVNVGIAQVARELGASRPTVYRHYASTERLLIAVAADSIGPLMRQIDTAFEGFGGTLGDMIVEQLALLLEFLPQEPYLGLLLTSGNANVFAKRMTSGAVLSLGMEFMRRLPVDWGSRGYDDETLGQLLEFTTRIVQSFVLDPGDHPRTGVELRHFLQRWVGTAVDAQAQSVWIHTDIAGAQSGPTAKAAGDPPEEAMPAVRGPLMSPGLAEDEALSQLSAFMRFASRPAAGPCQRRRRAVVARLPVTESEISVLQAMHRYECPSVGELAACLSLERSTVSRLVGQLTRLGLMHRETQAADRRRVRIGLTDTGRNMLTTLEHIAGNDLEAVVATWDPADIQTLGKLVDRLRQSLEGHQEGEDDRR
jgi:AcrR family transcriptional regulator